MTELFVAVSDHLEEEVPQLKWIDADNGQLETYEERPPVAFPCALIDVQLPQCEDFSARYQQCTATIRVRLGFDTTGERTAAQTPLMARERSLQKYALIDGVYRALQGYCTDSFTELSRQSMTPMMIGGYKVYEMTFETTFADETAMV